MVKKAKQPTAATAQYSTDLIDAAVNLGAIEQTDDVVDYTLRCVLAMAPAFAAHLATVESHVRSQFGGDTVWVARRRDLEARNHAIRQDWQRGERANLLARRYKLSPVQIWRIVNGVPNH